MCESANLSRPSLLTYDFERDNKVYELQEQLHDLNVDVSKMTIQLQANVQLEHNKYTEVLHQKCLIEQNYNEAYEMCKQTMHLLQAQKDKSYLLKEQITTLREERRELLKIMNLEENAPFKKLVVKINGFAINNRNSEQIIRCLNTQLNVIDQFKTDRIITLESEIQSLKKHCQQCLANDLERQNLLSLLNSKTTAEIEVLEGELYSVRKAVVEYDVKLKELQVSRDKAISSSTSLLIQIEELKSALKMRDRKIEFLQGQQKGYQSTQIMQNNIEKRMKTSLNDLQQQFLLLAEERDSLKILLQRQMHHRQRKLTEDSHGYYQFIQELSRKNEVIISLQNEVQKFFQTGKSRDQNQRKLLKQIDQLKQSLENLQLERGRWKHHKASCQAKSSIFRGEGESPKNTNQHTDLIELSTRQNPHEDIKMKIHSRRRSCDVLEI